MNKVSAARHRDMLQPVNNLKRTMEPFYSLKSGVRNLSSTFKSAENKICFESIKSNMKIGKKKKLEPSEDKRF